MIVSARSDSCLISPTQQGPLLRLITPLAPTAHTPESRSPPRQFRGDFAAARGRQFSPNLKPQALVYTRVPGLCNPGGRDFKRRAGHAHMARPWRGTAIGAEPMGLYMPPDSVPMHHELNVFNYFLCILLLPNAEQHCKHNVLFLVVRIYNMN